MKVPIEQLERAVNWWVEQLNPKTVPVLVHDGSDYVEKYISHNIFPKEVTQAQKEEFKQVLIKSMEGRDLLRYELRVDIMPSYYMKEAAFAANIPLLSFPSHTCMEFLEDGGLRVSVGLFQQWEDV